MRLTTILGAVAVALGAGLTACGDDTQALTKDEFIAQADALCQASNDELDVVMDPMWVEINELDEADPDTPQTMMQIMEGSLDEIMAIWRDQLDEIRGLVPPETDRDLIAELLDDQDAVLDEFDRLIRAGADGDPEALATLESDENPGADVNRRAREYGLVVCGSDD